MQEACAPSPLDQHLYGSVRQLQELQDGRHGADLVQILLAGIVNVGLGLRDQQYFLVGRHGEIHGNDGLVPPDEQRDHHLRVYDHIAQGKNRQPLELRLSLTGGVVQVKLLESGMSPMRTYIGDRTTNTQARFSPFDK